jgi:hypothetical protein
MTMVSQMPRVLYEGFERLNLGFVAHTKGITIEVEPTLEQEIRKGQLEDPKTQEIREMIEADKAPDFTEDEHGTVWFRKRICVPDVDHVREKIMQEAHDLAYSIHPGSTKMYQDLKERYWWYGMKHDVAAHMALCDVCQRVKAEHQRPASLLQPLKVPEWKWEEIGMAFIVGLPRTLWQNQPELYQLKYASPLPRAPTCFKRYNPLVWQNQPGLYRLKYASPQ